MSLLQDKAGKTWSDTKKCLQKSSGKVPPYRIKTVVESSVTAAEKVGMSASDSELAAFFQTKVTIEPEVGPFAADIGFTPASLKDCSFNNVLYSKTTIGLVFGL